MKDAVAGTGSVRLFVGVPVRSSPALAAFSSRLGGLGRAVKVTREEQLHVTLKFLGDTDEGAVGGLADALDAALAGSVAFDWTLWGTGAFPSASRPSVVWAGADDGGRFASLAERVESAAGGLGFPREGRRFHPHVTLARVRFRPLKELGELLRETGEAEFGPQRAEDVVLFRSDLGRGGSVYTRVHEIRLGIG